MESGAEAAWDAGDVYKRQGGFEAPHLHDRQQCAQQRAEQHGEKGDDQGVAHPLAEKAVVFCKDLAHTGKKVDKALEKVHSVPHSHSFGLKAQRIPVPEKRHRDGRSILLPPQRAAGKGGDVYKRQQLHRPPRSRRFCLIQSITVCLR